MSKNGYAKYLGITDKAVRNAILSGKIKKGFDPVKEKIIKHIADKEYGHLHAVVKARPGVNQDKLAVRITKVNESEKVNPNSDKSEHLALKNVSPKKRPSKSEFNSDDDDTEPEDLKEYSYEELMAKIKITPSMSYSEAFKRTSILNLATAKMKAEELQGILVRKHDVESTLYEFGTQLKKALMSMPLRISDELLNATDTIEIINIMNKELTAILHDYANFDQVNLSSE